MTEPRSDGTSGKERDGYEIVATVLLGLAAVLAAFSSYQSALWGGVQDTEFNNSVTTANLSFNAERQADSLIAIDEAFFLELVIQWVNSPTETVDEFFGADIGGFILGNMTVEGQRVSESWFREAFDDDSDAEVAAYPFGGDYFNIAYEDSAAIHELSALQYEAARTANENGDNFELAVTFITMVFFFAGISIVLSYDKLRIWLLSVAGIIFAGSFIYVITLNWTF